MENPVRFSKFMSLVLRHQPEIIHLTMDSNGWVAIDELIHNAEQYANKLIDRETLEEIVRTNNKQRFIIDRETNRIRANQGHSITVDLGLSPQTPPDELYHGTATCFLDFIMRQGIKKMSRQYVHLSSTAETAKTVGQRHGKSIVLCVDAKVMHENGVVFYLSENKVWLVEYVPKEFMRIV
jgi:putative RNA 2'-phosphotransferase